MFHSIRTLKDVVDWGYCIGCGTCFAACRHNGVSLVNILHYGIRPQFNLHQCHECIECLEICPGYSIDGDLQTNRPANPDAFYYEFGDTLEIWEGYAADPEIRQKASSGGLLSALSLYCLEQEHMAFVVHAGSDPSHPWLNQTRRSRNREDILSTTGSRYAPASPGEGLGWIEQSDRPCVFVGKPCDAAGAVLLSRKRPLLNEKLGLVLTFFCAGTPSTQGTLDLIQSLQIQPDTIRQLRYRGEGWPGRFTVQTSDHSEEKSFSYDESWRRLTKYRPLRCHLCPDGLGQIADLSCGDAWHKHGNGKDPGRSLVLVRTARGREILHKAWKANYVVLTASDANAVLAAQPNLLQRRKWLFGRLLALRCFLTPIPRFVGFSLFRCWWTLPLWIKVKTVLGTARRIFQRGWFRRTPIRSNGLTSCKV